MAIPVPVYSHCAWRMILIPLTALSKAFALLLFNEGIMNYNQQAYIGELLSLDGNDFEDSSGLLEELEGDNIGSVQPEKKSVFSRIG